MNIAYIGGHWHTNIGNAFYNYGAMSLLKRTFKNHNVNFVPDPPQELWPKLTSDYRLIDYLDADLFVISGPSFNKLLPEVYGKTFEIIKAQGGRIGFLSIGASEYSDSEADFVSEFLNNYPIDFVVTRDSRTYALYKNRMNFNIFNGVCTSMFLDDALTVPHVNDDYIVFNFDYFGEPLISLIEGNYAPRRRLFSRCQQNFEGRKIVRTNNNPYVPYMKLMFNRPNMYWSDLPEGYLSILKSAHCVFSDRVHTCCATLIQGGEAMYIKTTKRSRDGRNLLFERLGVANIFNSPQRLNFDYICREKENMSEFLSGLY